MGVSRANTHRMIWEYSKTPLAQQSLLIWVSGLESPLPQPLELDQAVSDSFPTAVLGSLTAQFLGPYVTMVTCHLIFRLILNEKQDFFKSTDVVQHSLFLSLWKWSLRGYGVLGIEGSTELREDARYTYNGGQYC